MLPPAKLTYLRQHIFFSHFTLFGFNPATLLYSFKHPPPLTHDRILGQMMYSFSPLIRLRAMSELVLCNYKTVSLSPHIFLSLYQLQQALINSDFSEHYHQAVVETLLASLVMVFQALDLRVLYAS